MDERYETHECDVLVVGAGGAGLRAAIEASAQGVRTALVCKSLLGKAHTVMAEGGIAAALGNVWPEDNWKVHFRDTMRGGKLLNNWRMAQIHAQEAPARVLELEEWGALFDRTKDGLILQRDFGGHRYARLAHVGDRTGLEMIRTLQDAAVAKGIDVFMECTLRHLLTDGERVTGAMGYWRQSGKLVAFGAKAVVLATGGVGKAWRGTFDSRGVPRDEVARAINSEVKAGRGTEHGGVFLDIATRRSADYIKRRLPSMYHQFKELADVDITKQQMEIGPTLHYIMGGIRVDPDTEAATVPGLYAAGEVAAGMHGANRLGGNSLSDLLVFGRRAGEAAAAYSKRASPPKVDEAQLDAHAQQMEAPFQKVGDENPYAIHSELQDMMQELVGIIRRRDELEEALVRLERLRVRAARARVTGSRVYNPGWHLALDLNNLIGVSEAVTRSALVREESRGGHTREDFPKTDAEWGTKNVVVRRRDGRLVLTTEPIAKVPAEMRALLGEDKPTGEAATGAKTVVAAGDD